MKFLKDFFSLKTLECVTHKNWGSQQPDHRTLIRQHLLKHHSPLYPEKVLDLKTPLTNLSTSENQISLSISHCHQMGGFVITHDPFRGIGFDIEEKGRIQKKTIHRIQNATDSSLNCPHFSYFWVAKEASFKSLSSTPLPPLMLSELSILEWKKEESPYVSFRAIHLSHTILGIVWEENSLLFSIAILK